RPLDSSAEQTLEVRYQRVGKGPGGAARALPPMLSDGDFIAEEGTYLRSEARWYPATGELDFRAPVSVTVTVPRGYTAVSVGRLMGIDKAGGTATFRWATSRPAAMIAVAAARYVESSLTAD